MAVDIRVRRPPDQDCLVYLIGTGGAGKSTVGEILSRELAGHSLT